VAHTSTVRSFVAALAACAVFTACAGQTQRSQSVQQVDELLTHIERVQVETAVAKDAAHAVLSDLCALVSPSFKGDAAPAFAEFMESAESCEKQGIVLKKSVEPMTRAADQLFLRWTKDLESFGNTRMRQRSQSRLDETRTRYQSILGATQAAQIALDSYNKDLRDHALFLRHDLNATSVESIRADVRLLNEQIQELDKRFDATTAAARAYVESTALYGQVSEDGESTTTTDPSATTTTSPAKTAPNPFSKKKPVSTLKPKTGTTTNSSASSSSTPPTEPKPSDTPGGEPSPVEPQPQSTPRSGSASGT
jgi:hypothetical protein